MKRGGPAPVPPDPPRVRCLGWLQRQWRWRGRRGSGLGIGLGIAVAIVAIVGAWVRCGPLPPGFLDLGSRVSTEVVDRRGRPLFEALSGEGGRARPLAPDALPKALVEATLAAEDARFFRHPGLDPLALARAAWHDLRALRFVEGGSTLSQQTVKLLLQPRRRRGLLGKAREAVLALRLEHRLGKREILALYLSLAPYGNQLVGAEAASRAYFGCPAASLTPAQAAFLAGLPQRPSALDPYRSLDAARRRQRWVLSRMERTGALSPAEAERAREERLALRREGRALVAAHFVERVLGSVAGPPPRRVVSTLDLDLQRRLQGILASRREGLEGHGAHNVAVAVLDNASAEWLAWEGSGDWFDREHGGTIDGVVTPRQPGSALKPFTYALAFERGFTPATVLPDLPSHFPTGQEGVLYSPRNYDGVFRGPLRARAALAGSENVPAVHLLSQVGVPDLLRLLRRAGLTTLDRTAEHYGYALTMGDAEVRLDELVAAYGALARGGLHVPPRLVREVVAADGARVDPGPLPPAQRLVSERSAFWVGDVLADPRARAYAFGRGGPLELPFTAAVKTGTSQSFHDNWTLGFTREVTVGVWVGNFDREPLRNSSGVTGAAPVLRDVLLAAQEHVTGRPPGEGGGLGEPPPGLSPRPICALSGLLATDECPVVETEWLPAESFPARCSWHRRERGRAVVAWPTRYRAWARELGLLSAAAPPPRAAARAAEAGLRIVNPPDGATYLRDPTLRAAFQSLPLRAEAGPGARTLVWRVDGVGVGSARAEAALDWPLEPGRHTVVVTDERGRSDRATILVR